MHPFCMEGLFQNEKETPVQALFPLISSFGDRAAIPPLFSTHPYVFPDDPANRRTSMAWAIPPVIKSGQSIFGLMIVTASFRAGRCEALSARSASRQSVADRGRILIRRRTDAGCPAQLRPVSISILMKRRRATPGATCPHGSALPLRTIGPRDLSICESGRFQPDGRVNQPRRKIHQLQPEVSCPDHNESA